MALPPKVLQENTPGSLLNPLSTRVSQGRIIVVCRPRLARGRESVAHKKARFRGLSYVKSA